LRIPDFLTGFTGFRILVPIAIGSGLRIADFLTGFTGFTGLRISDFELRIADCGFSDRIYRISNFGLRIADFLTGFTGFTGLRISDFGFRIADFGFRIF
jgi:hypothetical protein